MTSSCDVAIVGAGPYGLSLAAHLRESDVTFRIFGSPMYTWRQCMPTGMLLKSDGFASNLYDPNGKLTLERFCETHRIAYDHTRVPVHLETFRRYGMAFQEHLVPELEDTQVSRIERDQAGFRFTLNDGTSGNVGHVVVAVGISHFHHVPQVLADLPIHFVTHSSAHGDLERFAGLDVAVVGAGASAIDTAVLLQERGARVTLIARRSSLRFADPPQGAGSVWHSMLRPRSPIGPGWKSRLLSDAPWLFHCLPVQQRLRIVGNFLGPAAGWPMKDRFTGKVSTLLGRELQRADIDGSKVRLVLKSGGELSDYRFDHVIAATGYKIDLQRLTFLSPDILSEIKSVQNAPVLTSDFESSIPGLFFVGMASMYSFGPLMRFACGAGWTAKRITRNLANGCSRRPVVSATEALVG